MIRPIVKRDGWNGELQVWLRIDAERYHDWIELLTEYDDIQEYERRPPRPAPTFILNRDEQDTLTYELLRGEPGPTGPQGAQGVRGPDA